MAGCLCCGGRWHRYRPEAPWPTRRGLLAGMGAGGLVVAAGTAAAGPLDQLLGSLVSPEQERELGTEAFRKLKRQVPISRNRELQGRLERVGVRLVAASESDVPVGEWEFVVFKSDEINAFALPGGKVGLFEGIFKLFANDDQLATVLGHEIGHVIARHSAERIGAQSISQIGASFVAQLLGLDSASGADQFLAGLLGAGAQYGIVMPYARGQELEADRLGLTSMARAGYDPAESIGFWRKMMQVSGSAGPAFLSTHPSDEQRIAEIERLQPEAEAIYQRSR